MAISERLALLVTLDAQGAVKGFNDLGKAADKNLGKADQRLDRLASQFQKAGAGMLATSGLAAVGLYKAGQAAGDLEQAMGGTEAVFGDASKAIDDFAKKAAQSAGLSESAFRTATTSIGGQLKGLGFTVDEAANQAVNLTQIAADLSATYGGTTAEAVAALGAAFRGEADPAERFNLFLNQTRVNAKAVEMGLAATTSSVDAHAKAQAVMALVTEQSADAQGQFAREADTAQGAMARFRAESENLLAALGGAVAPVIADVAGGVGGLVEKFNDLPKSQQNAISKFLVLGTAALGTAGALSFTVGKVIDMRENLSNLAGPFRSAEGGMSRLGKAAAGLGLVGTIAGLAAIANEAGKTVVDVNEMADGLARLTAESEEQQKAAILIADRWGQLDTIVSQLADSNAVAATKYVDLAEAAGVGADQIARYRQEINDNRRVQAQAIIDQQENASAIDDTVSALGGLPPASKGAASAMGEVSSAADRQKDALDKARESTDLFKQGLEEAFGDLTIEAATDRRAQAFEDMAERFKDAQQGVVDARQRIRDLEVIPVEDRGESYLRDLAAAQTDLQEALAETDRSLEGNSAVALQNREDLRGAVDDIAAVIEAHRNEGASLEDLQFIRALERQALIDQLDQLGFNQEEIGRYVEAIDAIPLTKATTITADTAEAEAKVKALLAVISAVPGSIDAAVADRNLQRLQTNPDRRAIGGPVSAGQRYSVNEYLGAGRGFEWFAPSNGTISAAAPTAGTTIEQTVNIFNPVAEPVSDSARHLRRIALEVA